VIRAWATAALLLCAFLAGCGGTSQPSGTTTAETTTGATRSVEIYYLRGNALVPVRVSIAATLAIATASLQKLLSGPPDGYRTAIPSGTALESVAVSGGHATVQLSTGQLTRSAQGQIAYTLTQFPSITAVDGGPFTTPASRADFADLTPNAAIFVAEPERDSTIASPVQVSGTADVFEGTLAVDVWSGGKRLRTQTIQASSGTGTRGSWSASIRTP